MAKKTTNAPSKHPAEEKRNVSGFLVPLANMDEDDVGRFRARYRIQNRYSDEMLLTFRDELRFFWGGPVVDSKSDTDEIEDYRPDADWGCHGE